MKEIRAIDEEAHKHLMRFPPRYWSKFRFTEHSKCDTLVNNMSKTFNRVIFGPKGKPIMTMLEEINGERGNK
jgi:hypothetical protein